LLLILLKKLFVEQVSSVGVTGARAAVSGRVEELLKEIKEVRACLVYSLKYCAIT